MNPVLGVPERVKPQPVEVEPVSVEAAAEDIRSMRVRGAAKIGRHAARALGEMPWDGEMASLESAAALLVAARPTAVSLPNAVDFVVERVRAAAPRERIAALPAAAAEFDARARVALDDLGRHGSALIAEGSTVLTICNSQGALAPLFAAKRAGRPVRAIALETRPWRQGLLTVAQLAKAGVPASLAVDSAAWSLLPECAMVLTGADAIAVNGDVINKIGTGGLAVLARERGVPLYVCAETFKLSRAAENGHAVPIEERGSAEVIAAADVPEGVSIRNPVFDVTPARLVSGYITELGVLQASELLPAARAAWGWP